MLAVQTPLYAKLMFITLVHSVNVTTVMILSFRTDMPGQTVQTQIRLLIRVYTVCHSVCIFWTHYSVVEPHSSNFRVITFFWGVRIFRKFMVMTEISDIGPG